MEEINKIVTAYNWANLDERIEYLLDGVVERETKQAYVRSNIELLSSFIDYTTLKTSDNHVSVERFMADLEKKIEKNSLSNVASVCTWMNLLPFVKASTTNQELKLTTVAGMFPSSQGFLDIKLLECKRAVESGAHEIDVVINIGEMLAGNYEVVLSELKQMREELQGVTMKVILESGELKSMEMIFRAAMIAMYAGADFIKSSTGKTAVNATGESIFMMSEAVKLYFEQTGRKVGIKVSGGVGKTMSALRYYVLVKHVLGEEWMTPCLFRIGASTLLDDIIKELRYFDENMKEEE